MFRPRLYSKNSTSQQEYKSESRPLSKLTTSTVVNVTSHSALQKCHAIILGGRRAINPKASLITASSLALGSRGLSCTACPNEVPDPSLPLYQATTQGFLALNVLLPYPGDWL